MSPRRKACVEARRKYLPHCQKATLKGRVLSAGEVPCADQRWQPLPTTDGNSVGASTKRPHHDTHPRASALARVWRCTQCTIKRTIPYLNSPVVREALLHKGVGRRTRRLLVQAQGAQHVHSLTTTYHRRHTKESLGAFCRGHRPPFGRSEATG